MRLWSNPWEIKLYHIKHVPKNAERHPSYKSSQFALFQSAAKTLTVKAMLKFMVLKDPTAELATSPSLPSVCNSFHLISVFLTQFLWSWTSEPSFLWDLIFMFA